MQSATLKITQSQRQTLNLNHKLQLERKIKPIKLRNKLSIKIKTLLFFHGFGFTDDINPSVLAHYWGDKLNIRQDLEENGYESYEASISAFGSNYDRAVELYYYIKGGTVDYGATRRNMVMNVTVKHMKAYMKIGNQAKSTSCRT